MAFVLAWSPSLGVVGAAAGYLAVGGVVAAALHRRSAESATVWSALAVWPLLLPLFADRSPTLEGTGPLAGRIGMAFDAIERAVALPGATDPSWSRDLASLRAALLAADRRLGLVDGLLADGPATPEVAVGSEAQALREARNHAEREVLDVLAALERLRLQIGMLVLAGEGARVTEHLRQLQTRVAALDEVSRLLPPAAPV